MNFKNISIGLFLLLCNYDFFGQDKNAAQFFTSEVNTAPLGDDIIISVKKYNATADEIKNAAVPAKDGSMTYLQVPIDATKISIFDKGFQSVLYCLDNEGKEKWNNFLGYSKNSSASPIAVYKNFIYTGEGFRDKDKVTLKKLNGSGNVLWTATIDSVENVNSIYAEDNIVTALISFEGSEKVATGNGQFSDHVYPIYFLIQLDIETGKVLKKEYQMMGNYLSKSGYDNPLVGNSNAYYLNNKDSAIFLSFAKQDGATVVSGDKDKNAVILALTAAKESYHYLTLLTLSPDYKEYRLVSDFYGKEKKYNSKMPVVYTRGFNRYFLLKNETDSLFTVIQTNKNISLINTDVSGNSTLYKTITTISTPVVGAGLQKGKFYIVYLEGRTNNGKPGKLRINYY